MRSVAEILLIGLATCGYLKAGYDGFVMLVQGANRGTRKN